MPKKRIILAIDPGTKCGWAAGNCEAILGGGTWDLTSKHHESHGMRFWRFQQKLHFINCITPLFAIVYEEVRMHRGVQAAHIYGGFEAHIQSFCMEHTLIYISVPVGTIKKHITGKGNASKSAVIKAVRTKLKVPVDDDNHADALALFDYARKTYL